MDADTVSSDCVMFPDDPHKCVSCSLNLFHTGVLLHVMIMVMCVSGQIDKVCH